MPGYKKDVSAMKTARKNTTTANIASTVRQKTKPPSKPKPKPAPKPRGR